MAKSSANKAVKVEGTSMNELVKEGKALGKIWATVNSLKATTKASGFDTRLGKLMSVLKAQSTVDSGQIPTHVLRTHGIDKIDRRRRSEALWFYENQAECVEFIKASKKGFTSLTALQSAMKKADKSNDGPNTESDGDDDTSTSNVNAESIVANVLATAKKHNIDLQQVVEMLIDSATSTDNSVVESEVA